MKVVVSGSGGYIGKRLVERLIHEKIDVIAITREILYGASSELALILSGCDVVINLAGAPILQRWTPENKKIIYHSRVHTTRNLVAAINSLSDFQRPRLFISTSAIGIYKNDETHDESSMLYDDGFLGHVVSDWENASENIERTTRRVIFRLGVVLGKDSKTLQTMLPIFKLGLGGTIGNGKQSFPFVHINDVVSAFFWAMKNEEVQGIYNLVAPQTINNKEFTVALAKRLNRPAIFQIPAFVLKLLYGESAGLLIKSPTIIPSRLNQKGFPFQYTCIDDVVNAIIAK